MAPIIRVDKIADYVGPGSHHPGLGIQPHG